MSFDADIIVVGAGPAGLAFCRALADSNLSLMLIEQQPQAKVAQPAFDGREIAISHRTRQRMQTLGLWQGLPPEAVYLLKDAKVLNGNSDFTLHFEEKAPRIPGEGLGFLIPNHLIRQASYDATQHQTNLQAHYGVSVKDVQLNAEGASVVLSDGRQLRARLLVAADSRFSSTRRQMGIGADMNDFGRTVHVFRMRHSLSNEHTAIECFHYGRTLAILPLESHLSSCVVTIDTHRNAEITALSPVELATSIENQLKYQLGDMQLEGEIVSYPLVGVHAKRFYGVSSALIGDAAVGMHPVTAHGYNLGLQSACLLAEQIQKALQQGKDFASPAVLSQYHFLHSRHTRIMYHGTNAIVKLFTTETAPVKLLRSAVLRFSHYCPPLKKAITKQLTDIAS